MPNKIIIIAIVSLLITTCETKRNNTVNPRQSGDDNAVPPEQCQKDPALQGCDTTSEHPKGPTVLGEVDILVQGSEASERILEPDATCENEKVGLQFCEEVEVFQTGLQGVNLRAGPGLDFEKQGTALDGEVFKVLEHKISGSYVGHDVFSNRGSCIWYKVDKGGTEVWISATFVGC